MLNGTFLCIAAMTSMLLLSTASCRIGSMGTKESRLYYVAPIRIIVSTQNPLPIRSAAYFELRDESGRQSIRCEEQPLVSARSSSSLILSLPAQKQSFSVQDWAIRVSVATYKSTNDGTFAIHKVKNVYLNRSDLAPFPDTTEFTLDMD